MIDGHTTIRLEKETRKKLASVGRKGQTYDQIVNRLLKERIGERD